MTFLEDRQNDLFIMFSTDTFGEEIVYTPKGGEPAIVTALIQRDESLPSLKNGGLYTGIPVSRDYRSNFRGGGKQAVAVVWIQKTDVPVPAHGDTVTFDGETWTVKPVFTDAAESGKGFLR